LGRGRRPRDYVVDGLWRLRRRGTVLPGRIGIQEQGQPEDAIAQYDKAIEADSESAPSYLNRGNAYDLLGQVERAIKDYDEAIRIDPEFALAYMSRGIAFNKLRQPMLSLKDLDETINLQPDFAPAYVN
tara:strand:- start:11338 stop:11724 length:387 start_codon:yes stop_codon:yes gene_type:complete